MGTQVKYLGQAIKFPFEIINGRAKIADSKQSIEDGITALLNTPYGSRFMVPEYGSRLHELLFEQNDEVLYQLLRLFIFESIKIWEKRVRFMDVTFSQENEVVNCNISYKILATSEAFNFIYPFYKNIKI